jgi:hypothetical protein
VIKPEIKPETGLRLSQQLNPDQWGWNSLSHLMVPDSSQDRCPVIAGKANGRKKSLVKLKRILKCKITRRLNGSELLMKSRMQIIVNDRELVTIVQLTKTIGPKKKIGS